MFIRATRTGTASDGSPRLTHRLVENQRRDGKVRQTTLLNLGRHFSIDRKAWPLLCERIKELLSGQSALGLEPLAPQCEAEARRITARLLQRQGEETTGADWETLDVASVCDSDGRCVGVEHAALAALDMLGLPGLFDELGFNRRQRCCALANIIARMAHPGSERATNRWLRATSATGELLGLDFGSVSDMALYRASDLLLFHQKRIEEHVFGTAQTLFDLAPTITLYDLTNTFYEGQAAGQPKAQRGHSKEGRTDAPLLTLGLVLDASGFVRRSSVFAGNITEATTLGAMLESLGASREGVIIMDRGIATKANLAWLRDNGYRYLVVSRDSTRVFDADKAATTVTTASRETVDIYIEEVVCEEQDARSYREVLLRCHSEARAKKEKGILDRFQKRFEEALAALHEGLSKPRTRKGLDSIQRRIGRLQKANSRVAQHYEITLTPEPTVTSSSPSSPIRPCKSCARASNVPGATTTGPPCAMPCSPCSASQQPSPATTAEPSTCARRRSPTTSRPLSITPWASRHRRATSARPWSDAPSHPHQSAVCHPQHSACSATRNITR